MVRIEDFVKKYAPKHEGLEAVKSVESEASTPADRLAAIARTFAVKETAKTKPSHGLFDTYVKDPGDIRADTQQRPEHYTDRMKEVAEALADRRESSPPVTEQDKSSLLLQYMRSTESSSIVRKAVSQTTDSRHGDGDEGIVLENEKPKKPTFEDQDYGPSIVIV